MIRYIKFSTKIKIRIARILNLIVTFFVGKDKKVINRNNINYEVDISEGIDLSLFLFGNFQQHIINNKHIQIKSDDVILDIGANVGCICLEFAKKVPHGKVYAFEPTYYALKKLTKNLALNPALSERITVIQSFVSDESKQQPKITAYSSWKVDGKRSKEDHQIHFGTPKNTYRIPSISLNDFFQQQQINKLNLIKIDTDGHEYEIFKGAEDIIRRFRPVIIFEICIYLMEEKGINFDFYETFFRNLNYSLIECKTNKIVDSSNYRKYIPKNGGTDLIALPQSFFNFDGAKQA
jgi:FkbM family methyltransferase